MKTNKYWLCNRDLRMEDDNERVFTAGETYEQTGVRSETTIELTSDRHEKHGVSKGSWLDHFSLADKNDEEYEDE